MWQSNDIDGSDATHTSVSVFVTPSNYIHSKQVNNDEMAELAAGASFMNRIEISCATVNDPSHGDVAQLSCFALSAVSLLNRRLFNSGMAAPLSQRGPLIWEYLEKGKSWIEIVSG